MRILKEGIPFILLSLLVSVILVTVSFFIPRNINIICFAVGALSFIFALFCVLFFRDPKITITCEEGVILSPCNGTVMEIAEDNGMQVIRIFLSVFDVHLQRSPVSGTITNVVHKDGKFLAAWNPRAHIENEQNIFTIQGDGANTKDNVYIVQQIAGLVARRCVSWVKAGDNIKAGDKIGMIKFSSQVDLHLPKTAVIAIKPGDKVKAGITIAAKK
ncbi:MAG: phosphatidylserine decarboxylase [Treponema sp.]|jgi:phosphatidylserine decarboxylase|nr:phosphatidylserine decarboxylase [Treponema sp.]